MLRKISAVLAALTVAVHFFLGGSDALVPMLAADLPPESAGAMHACWHIVTVFLAWSAIVFWRGGETALHFGLLWIASALVFICVGLNQAGLEGVVNGIQPKSLASQKLSRNSSWIHQTVPAAN